MFAGYAIVAGVILLVFAYALYQGLWAFVEGIKAIARKDPGSGTILIAGGIAVLVVIALIIAAVANASY
jgi:hypothetical protein